MDVASLLNGIPESLRNELLDAYITIEKNYREERWEPSELNGGKLSEVAYSILKGFVDGNYPTTAYKPDNMVDDCRALERASVSIPRSIRVQIPKMLMSLYDIRSTRGVGHVGGDVDPNNMDAICVLHMSKWVLAEFIRFFHNVSTEEATMAVDAISQRELQLVWRINGKKRVMDSSLSMKDSTLLLLYTDFHGLKESELVSFLEHSNPSVYRRDVLRGAHKDRLLEYDNDSKMVRISPKGTDYVEKKILKKRNFQS